MKLDSRTISGLRRIADARFEARAAEVRKVLARIAEIERERAELLAGQRDFADLGTDGASALSLALWQAGCRDRLARLDLELQGARRERLALMNALEETLGRKSATEAIQSRVDDARRRDRDRREADAIERIGLSAPGR